MRPHQPARLAPPAVLLVCLAAIGPCSARSEASSHSAVHALASLEKAAETGARPTYYQAPPASLGLAVKGDKWAVYSRGVNRITASATRGSETWLATDMGVKLVDRARKTVTHFTRLDGLPDDHVTAITADAESAWAIVATKHGDAFVAALCEYRRSAGKWRVLRETPRPIVPVPQSYGGAANQVYTPGGPLQNSLVAACPEKVCFALSPIRRDNTVMALCYDRRLNLWDEIPCPPALLADRTTLSVTWLDVDRDGLWIGSTAGLLRYRLREKQWQRYLPDRMVYAATKADDGSLWLATYQGSAQPADLKAPVSDASFPTGRWSATHFTPRSALSKHYAVPDATGRQPAYGVFVATVLSGISIADRSVWLTPGRRTPYGTQAPFYRLYPQDETWRTYSVQNQAEMDSVPDAALEQPTIPRSTLITAYYPWRLTDWICHDGAETPPDPARKSAAASRDANGALWTSDGRTVQQTDEHGVTLGRFGLGQISIPVTPQITAVTLLDGHLYAMTNGDVQAYDLLAGTWKRVRLPRSGWSNPGDERLIPDGDRLWIGTPSMALRYDPRTAQFSAEFVTQNGGFRLLGSTAGTVWLRGPDSLLYKTDPVTGEAETAEMAPLPAEIATRYGPPLPFGLAAKMLWFRLQDKRDAEKCMYIGYDPEAGAWTRGHAAPKPYPSPPSCFGVGRRAYIPMAEDDASVRCYNAETGQWSVAAPKEPHGHGALSQTMISVDDTESWSFDNSTRTLICFHRETASWTFHEMPQSLYVQQTGNEAVRAGGTIYLATNLGVWAFDLHTHAWTQLPGFVTRDIYLNGIVVEPAAVWSIARPINGNQAIAVRLDKTTHRWTAWTEKEGFPERAYPNTIVPDGKTAWVLASGECFHLDGASNRWYNVSARLGLADKDERIPRPASVAAVKTAGVQVSDVVPDGASVWILPAGQSAGKDNVLLVRYDKATGSYDRLGPAMSHELIGRSMQVDPDAVWVPTPSGVFRYGKEDRTWRKVDPPAAVTAWVKLETQSVIQHERSYWFFGVDDAVHWDE